jgi:hypothetical protein
MSFFGSIIGQPDISGSNPNGAGTKTYVPNPTNPSNDSSGGTDLSGITDVLQTALNDATKAFGIYSATGQTQIRTPSYSYSGPSGTLPPGTPLPGTFLGLSTGTLVIIVAIIAVLVFAFRK